MLQLYTNIKKYRLERKMTQEELAHKLGYADKSMIAKIESGKIDLSQSKIMAFAAILDVTPGKLMGWENRCENAAPDTPLTFTDEETRIIRQYRELNDEGKELVKTQLKLICASHEYKKDYQYREVEKHA